MLNEVGTLNQRQAQLAADLNQLAAAFSDFVKNDGKQKSLQLAETRQGNLKQDLEIKFGYYGEVRRMATGILQGVDTGIVSDGTLRATTEEVMLKAPGYWLAPALITVASWIRNDKATADKALNESLRRDDYKTTLFFMLVMRRLNRYEASLQWLNRYFMHQNPYNLDREFVIILEAVTTGVFPPAARQLMMKNAKSWLAQLTQSGDYINDQKAQWLQFFHAKAPVVSGKYPLLEQFCNNWTALETYLQTVSAHEPIQAHFKNVIGASTDLSKAIKVQLDEILSMLVTNFDDEELPLQQQVRLNELIIDMDGDKAAAQSVMDAEKHIFQEKVDFLQLLTNAAFNPAKAGASKVTQALAVSISQPWIVEAHDTFTANSRNSIPNLIVYNIDGFTAGTQDGSDEESLLGQHEGYWTNVLKAELAKAPYPTSNVILGGLIIALGAGLLIVNPIVGVLAAGVGIWLVLNTLNKHKKTIQQIKDSTANREQKSKEVLRGCIAETVDYRKECAREDAKAEVVRALLTSITPEDFSSVSKDTRNILTTN
ncbi:hypothetical protein FLA_1444 [Filimonas lacunae]|nr:hypothetical protein FLA_1444 [Filimonas lacunae]